MIYDVEPGANLWLSSPFPDTCHRPAASSIFTGTAEPLCRRSKGCLLWDTLARLSHLGRFLPVLQNCVDIPPDRSSR